MSQFMLKIKTLFHTELLDYWLFDKRYERI